MGKYLAALVFGGCALIASTVLAASSAKETAADSSPTVAIAHHGRVPVAGLRDEAAMVLVGAALIGLAAAVRRAA